MTPNEPLLVSEQEAARRLGVSPRTLFTMRTNGEIPFVPVRGRNLYSVEALREWIRAHEQTGAAGSSSNRPRPHDSFANPADAGVQQDAGREQC